MEIISSSSREEQIAEASKFQKYLSDRGLGFWEPRIVYPDFTLTLQDTVSKQQVIDIHNAACDFTREPDIQIPGRFSFDVSEDNINSQTITIKIKKNK